MIAGIFSAEQNLARFDGQAMLRALNVGGKGRSDSHPDHTLVIGSTDPDGLSIGPDSTWLAADVRLDYRADLVDAVGGCEPDLSDAALVHLALCRWGLEALHRIEGDYALAWYRPAASTLVLARSALGQRPLFWTKVGNDIGFASMPRGLHAMHGVVRAPDLQSVAGFLQGGVHPAGRSFFKDIRRVDPGHHLVIGPGGIDQRRHWAPQARAEGCRTFDDYRDAFRERLDEAVRTRLPDSSEVLAVHLSGGLDSGAVAATASRIGDSRTLAFTSVPSERARLAASRLCADERELAGATAALNPRLDHRLIEADGASPLSQLGDGLRLHERPKFNLCNHPWLDQIRRAAAAEGAKVILTGEIGNWTISAGPHSALREVWRRSGPIRWLQTANALRAAGEIRWPGIMAATFLSPQTRDFLQPGDSSSLLRDSARQPESWNRGADWRQDAIAALSAMDFGEYRSGTWASSGIDERDATADPRLIAFCLGLPIDMILGPAGRRPLALAALGDRLPARVLHAKAKGYQGADWFLALDADRDRVEALLSAIERSAVSGAVIDVVRLRKLWNSWPATGWDRPSIISTYRNRFLQALTAGHFLVGAAGEELPF